jgi:hypothetical protein
MVLAFAGDDMAREAYYAVDMPEISLLGGSYTSPHMARAAAFALVVLAGLAATLAARVHVWPGLNTTALVAALAVSAVSSTILAYHIAQVPSERQYGKSMVQLVRDAGAHPGDVVVTSTDLDWAVLIMQQREIYWTKVRRFDQRLYTPPGHIVDFRAVPADATFFIAPWHDRRGYDWDGSLYGWHMVATDPRHGWAAWRRGDTAGSGLHTAPIARPR